MTRATDAQIESALSLGDESVAAVVAELRELRETAKRLAYAIELNEREWIASLDQIKSDLDNGGEYVNPALAVSAKKALKSLQREKGPDHMAILRELSKCS